MAIIALLMNLFVGWHIDNSEFGDVVGRERAAVVVLFLERCLVPAAVPGGAIGLVAGRIIQGA